MASLSTSSDLINVPIILLNLPIRVDSKVMQLDISASCGLSKSDLRNPLVIQGPPFVLPILVMPHLVHVIEVLLDKHVFTCLESHDYENVGRQVTSHTCLQCLPYSSIKCKNDKFMTPPILELPLTCLCHGCVLRWTCCVCTLVMLCLYLVIYFWGTMEHNALCP